MVQSDYEGRKQVKETPLSPGHLVVVTGKVGHRLLHCGHHLDLLLLISLRNLVTHLKFILLKSAKFDEHLIVPPSFRPSPPGSPSCCIPGTGRHPLRGAELGHYHNVQVDPDQNITNRCLIFLESFGVIFFCTNKISRVADTASPMRQVEGRVMTKADLLR